MGPHLATGGQTAAARPCASVHIVLALGRKCEFTGPYLATGGQTAAARGSSSAVAAAASAGSRTARPHSSSACRLLSP